MGLLQKIRSQRDILCEAGRALGSEERAARSAGGRGSPGSWEVSLMLFSQAKSGQWWGHGSSSPPSRRTLGEPENLQLPAWRRQKLDLIGPGVGWVVELGYGDPVF